MDAVTEPAIYPTGVRIDFSRVNAEAEEHATSWRQSVEFVKRATLSQVFVLNIQSYTEWLLNFVILSFLFCFVWS